MPPSAPIPYAPLDCSNSPHPYAYIQSCPHAHIQTSLVTPSSTHARRTHAHARTRMHTHACTCTRTHALAHTHMHSHTHTQTRARAQTHTHTHTNANTNTNTHTHTHKHIDIHIHTYTHTHVYTSYKHHVHVHECFECARACLYARVCICSTAIKFIKTGSNLSKQTCVCVRACGQERERKERERAFVCVDICVRVPRSYRCIYLLHKLGLLYFGQI